LFYMEKPKAVLVTGASGFLASQLVEDLLLKGYTVHATVRDPTSTKHIDHLTKLENAATRLKLFKADLLEEGSFLPAMENCTAVFHTASPFFFKAENPDEQLIKPAVIGTQNVLKSVAQTPTVKTLVVTSSIASVRYREEFGPDHLITEEDWSDEEYLRKIGFFYQLSKTMAEREVWKWEESIRGKVRVVCINPPFIIGPQLQATLNASTEFLLNFVNGSKTGIDDTAFAFVDNRDVSRAHILVFENEKAQGRYLCAAACKHNVEVAETLKKLLPERAALIPSKLSYKEEERKANIVVSSEKLKNLGLGFLDFEQSLKDTIRSAIKNKFLSII